MRKILIIVVAIFLLGSSGARQNTMKLQFPVLLNHFYVTVDPATYKAIESSTFLRGQFAPSEERTTVRTDRTYTGLYFYGANTYFEFFDASAQSGNKLGDSAVAFGVEGAGEIETLAKELASEFFLQPNPITRQFEGKQVPWFWMAVAKNVPLSSGFRSWIMEYHPRFLAEWNRDATGEKEGISRSLILRRYTAVLGARPARPLLEDVTALTIALDKATSRKLAEICESFGYRRSVQGSAVLLEGSGLLLRLVDATDSVRGIREITMKVKAKPASGDEIRAGNSVLKFRDDGLAVWSF